MIEELFDDWEPSELSLPFWEAARERRLVLQRCELCGSWQHPPRPVCVSCGDPGLSLAWREVSGRGTVYSYTVVERALIAALRDQVPYVLALIELEEGQRMLSLLLGCEPVEARIGLAVRLDFEPFGADLQLPIFRPAD